jgi:hypothetical protein
MDFEWTVLPEPKLLSSYSGTPYVTQRYTLRSHGLPSGFGYTVSVLSNGDINSRSDPGSNGGVRYYAWGNEENPKDVWAALDHGFKWARRHQRQLARGAK